MSLIGGPGSWCPAWHFELWGLIFARVILKTKLLCLALSIKEMDWGKPPLMDLCPLQRHTLVHLNCSGPQQQLISPWPLSCLTGLSQHSGETLLPATNWLGTGYEYRHSWESSLLLTSNCIPLVMACCLQYVPAIWRNKQEQEQRLCMVAYGAGTLHKSFFFKVHDDFFFKFCSLFLKLQ